MLRLELTEEIKEFDAFRTAKYSAAWQNIRNDIESFACFLWMGKPVVSY